MKPKSILDPDFQYVPAVETDLKKTFARIREQQAKEAAAKAEERARAKAIAYPEARVVPGKVELLKQARGN